MTSPFRVRGEAHIAQQERRWERTRFWSSTARDAVSVVVGAVVFIGGFGLLYVLYAFVYSVSQEIHTSHKKYIFLYNGCMSTNAAPKRIIIEVSEDARAKLKAVAAVKRTTIRGLVDELADRIEQETFGARRDGAAEPEKTAA
jgi:hypothetical protein